MLATLCFAMHDMCCHAVFRCYIYYATLSYVMLCHAGFAGWLGWLAGLAGCLAERAGWLAGWLAVWLRWLDKLGWAGSTGWAGLLGWLAGWLGCLGWLASCLASWLASWLAARAGWAGLARSYTSDKLVFGKI